MTRNPRPLSRTAPSQAGQSARQRVRVLIAGIGGASLGTEILKCLRLAKRYEVFGCDISPLAFGHYQPGLKKSFLASPKDYVPSVLEICRRQKISIILPGGEQPLVLLTEAREQLAQAGIQLAGNSPAVIEKCTDKFETFALLQRLGIEVPLTLHIQKPEDLGPMTYPCVVKPARDSGGSAFVFLAANRAEAVLYVTYLLQQGKKVIAQAYVPADEGEFTIGVLSLPTGRVVGSIALQRKFPAKLSVSLRSATGLISSGYSQGYIDDFPGLRAQAERVAAALGSTGPLNIQARVRQGKLLIFEINPRFSASTYLRAMAGFNELDIYLQYLAKGRVPARPPVIRPGYYLRSLSEVFVSAKALKQ